MTIKITDEHIEWAIELVRRSRGDATRAKTTRDLLREHLAHLGVLQHVSAGAAIATERDTDQPDAA